MAEMAAINRGELEPIPRMSLLRTAPSVGSCKEWKTIDATSAGISSALVDRSNSSTSIL